MCDAVYYFDENGAFVSDGNATQLPVDATRWHLVDSNYGIGSLPPTIYSRVGKIIQAASAEPQRYRSWVKHRSGISLWMEPFSWEEMHVIA